MAIKPSKKGKRDYSKLTVPELKELLKEKKLPVGGVKSELIERLVDPNWKRMIKNNAKNIKQGLLVLFGFYLMQVYFNYLDVKEYSRRRLGDGSYTSAKEITEFTSDEIMQILITNNNNSAVVLPFLVLFLLFLVPVIVLVIVGIISIIAKVGNGSSSKKGSQGQATVKGLGMLVGTLILIWGALVVDKQMESNDAADDLNEANKKTAAAAADADMHFTYKEVEKEYTGYIFPLVGLAILLFYFAKPD